MPDNERPFSLRCEAEVLHGGRVEVVVPLAEGTRVLVYVTEEPDKELDGLVAASQTTLGFWDNPVDDEDWNRA